MLYLLFQLHHWAKVKASRSHLQRSPTMVSSNLVSVNWGRRIVSLIAPSEQTHLKFRVSVSMCVLCLRTQASMRMLALADARLQRCYHHHTVRIARARIRLYCSSFFLMSTPAYNCSLTIVNLKLTCFALQSWKGSQKKIVHNLFTAFEADTKLTCI